MIPKRNRPRTLTTVVEVIGHCSCTDLNKEKGIPCPWCVIGKPLADAFDIYFDEIVERLGYLNALHDYDAIKKYLDGFKR